MMNEVELKLFYEGIRLFNSGHYYESHEEWEQIWLHRTQNDRAFFQGLIILAGAFCHLNKNLKKPALVAFKKVPLKWTNFKPDYLGVKTQEIETLIHSWIDYLEGLGAKPDKSIMIDKMD